MKRVLDFVGAATLLVVSAPIIAAAAIGVWSYIGRPVLFCQKRPGLNGKPFTLVKFRTMLDARAPDGTLLPDEIRLTGFGQFLRSTSFDELPQLWNVLKGDMSLVGPRPLLMEYLSLYSPEQARRHDVRPGITGWAQVNGRNAISWEEKFALDIWYVDHNNLLVDARIIGLTIWRLLSRKGISNQGHATMPLFRGSK